MGVDEAGHDQPAGQVHRLQVRVPAQHLLHGADVLERGSGDDHGVIMRRAVPEQNDLGKQEQFLGGEHLGVRVVHVFDQLSSAATVKGAGVGSLPRGRMW